MLVENILYGLISSMSLVTFEIGVISFFIVLGILSVTLSLKIIKNRKKNKNLIDKSGF